MPQIIVVTLAFILFALIAKPLMLVIAYFFVLPITHIFALEQLTLLSLPINWPFAAVIIVSVVPVGILRKNFRLLPPNTLVLYSLVFLSVLSCAYSLSLTASIAQTAKYLNALCLVLVTINAISSTHQIIRIYQGIVMSSVIPMMYGYYQYFTSTGHRVLGEQTDRITSFFGFANLYGIFLALIIFAVLILYVDTKNKRNKIIYGIVLVSAVVSTILALNRGTWIAITVGILLAFPFYRRFLSVKWLVAIYLVVGVAASTIIIQRFIELENPYTDTFSGRLVMSETIIKNAAKIPLLGYGAGNSEKALDKMFGITNVPHNDYLKLWLEMGIMGPLLYIVLILKEIVFNLSVRKHRDAWHVNYFTLAMIFYWGIISLAQNAVHDYVVFPMFIICCHLARRYILLSERNDAVGY